MSFRRKLWVWLGIIVLLLLLLLILLIRSRRQPDFMVWWNDAWLQEWQGVPKGLTASYSGPFPPSL